MQYLCLNSFCQHQFLDSIEIYWSNKKTEITNNCTLREYFDWQCERDFWSNQTICISSFELIRCNSLIYKNAVISENMRNSSPNIHHFKNPFLLIFCSSFLFELVVFGMLQINLVPFPLEDYKESFMALFGCIIFNLNLRNSFFTSHNFRFFTFFCFQEMFVF